MARTKLITIRTNSHSRERQEGVGEGGNRVQIRAPLFLDISYDTISSTRNLTHKF